MSNTTTISFPCEVFPKEARIQRLLGLYPQRQEGLFMQRLKLPGGRTTTAQWRVAAQLVDRFAPDWPLHVTTRQDIELHGLAPADIPEVQRGLAEAGVTTTGAGGDSLRNITVCPGSGLCPGSADVSPLAEAIRKSAESWPWVRTLPRKFKISLSSCGQACARPWINDIGLISQPDGAFRAVVGGSLGAKPGTGLLLEERLEAAQVVPFVIAALRLFNKEGDRANRTRARLRHVRERLGDDLFRRRLLDLFAEELRKPGWPKLETPPASLRKRRVCRLHLPLGDITAAQALELADAADRAKAELRIGLEHDVHVYSVSELHLSPELELLAKGPRVVACPGAASCSRGIAHARVAGGAIRGALHKGSPVGVAISGCPNNCAHGAVAEVGLVGRIKTVGETRTECYRLFAGGGLGKTPALAQELHEAVPATRVDGVVKELVRRYESAALSEESFAQFVEREKEELSQAIAAAVGE